LATCRVRCLDEAALPANQWRYSFRYFQHSPTMLCNNKLLSTGRSTVHHQRPLATLPASLQCTRVMTIASTSHRLDLHNTPLEARSKLAACPQGCDESHSRKDAMGAPPSSSAYSHSQRTGQTHGFCAKGADACLNWLCDHRYCKLPIRKHHHGTPCSSLNCSHES